jgi:hypothetical protein
MDENSIGMESYIVIRHKLLLDKFNIIIRFPHYVTICMYANRLSARKLVKYTKSKSEHAVKLLYYGHSKRHFNCFIYS